MRICAQVTAAIAMQLATLNTNARYLHEGLVSYAEALTATFPEELSVSSLQYYEAITCLLLAGSAQPARGHDLP